MNQSLNHPMTQSRNRPMPERLVQILFVCVGNACRSQMAEAIANHLGQGQVRAWSAGSYPAGWIADGTEEVLAEKGYSLEGHWSKGLDDVPISEMDVVVGMGCEVACPVPPGFQGRIIEWTIPDPFGSELEFFRSVRDLIEVQVKALIADISHEQEAGKNGV